MISLTLSSFWKARYVLYVSPRSIQSLNSFRHKPKFLNFSVFLGLSLKTNIENGVNKSNHLTCLTDFKVRHHSPLKCGWAWLTTFYNRCVKVTLGRISQGEGLSIEGNTHHQLPWISTFFNPQLEGEV